MSVRSPRSVQVGPGSWSLDRLMRNWLGMSRDKSAEDEVRGQTAIIDQWGHTSDQLQEAQRDENDWNNYIDVRIANAHSKNIQQIKKKWTLILKTIHCRFRISNTIRFVDICTFRISNTIFWPTGLILSCHDPHIIPQSINTCTVTRKPLELI